MASPQNGLLAEIEQRRSIRKYEPKPVAKARIERILKAGQLAPSAKNRQAWRFLVIQKKGLLQKLRDAAFGQEHVGQAPVIIAACTTNIDYRMPNGELSYPIDMAFAAAFMLLQATKEGLGSCVVSTFDEQEVKELLSIPYSMKVVLLILLGYSAQDPPLRSRKTLKQITSYDHW
jgi:nitroreductase